MQAGRNAVFYSLGPGTGGQGYAGKVVWNQDQTGRSRVVADADSRQTAVTNAYLVSLSDRVPGTVTYARHVSEASRDFDVLKIAPTGGYPLVLWIDSATHLIDRTVEPTAQQTQTTYYSDYRSVSGVMLPFVNRQARERPAMIKRRPFSASTRTSRSPIGAYVLSSELAKRLGVKPQGAAQGGGESSVDVGMGRVKSVRFGGITMVRPLFFVISLPFLKKNPIVGYEVFNRFVVRIDYDKHLLTFTEPKHFSYTGSGTVVPFRFNGRTPEVDGVVDGIPGVFTIDTGAGGSLSLTTPFVAKHQLIAKYRPKVTTISGYGVGGPERSMMTRVHALTIGNGVTAHELITGLSLDKAGSDANKALAGNIGEGFLHRFNLIVDYSRQRIIFERNSHFHDPDIENRSGLTLDSADGSGKVAAVVPGGPAAQAGIQVGDTLLSIDGKTPAMLPFGGARKIFQQPVGTRVRVCVLSNKRVRTVTIVLRDLI